MVFRRKKKEETSSAIQPNEAQQPEIKGEYQEPSGAATEQTTPAEGAMPPAQEARAEGSPSSQAEVSASQEAPQARATASTPQAEQRSPEKPSKKALFWRKVWRGILIALVLFGAGFVTAMWFFYRPAHQQAAAVPKMQAQLAADKQQLGNLQQQVKDLQNRLQAQENLVNQAKIRVAMAEALKSAYAARLALADNDSTGANIQMAALEKSLHNLQSAVPQEQKSAIGDLLAQTQDIKANLDSPSYADRQLKALIEHLQALSTILITP